MGQIEQQGTGFDFDAPLPPALDDRSRSWEPAARHYQDLTEAERKEYGA